MTSKSKWKDPEFLNLFAEPRYHPMSASIHRRLFSLMFVICVLFYTYYEVFIKGIIEEESLALPKETLYHSKNASMGSNQKIGVKTQEVITALYNKPTTSIPKPYRSWIPTDPLFKGSVQPKPKESSTNEKDSGISNEIHHEYTGPGEFEQHLPEIPLKIIVYGKYARHAVITQRFAKASKCTESLLKDETFVKYSSDGTLCETNSAEDCSAVGPRGSKIVTRMSGSTKGLYIPLNNHNPNEPDTFAPNEMSSSTLVLDNVDRKAVEKATFIPWYGTSVYSDLSEESCNTCNGRSDMDCDSNFNPGTQRKLVL